MQRVPRRVPTLLLRPPLDLCRTTGVPLGAGSRVVVMRDLGGVADALLPRLAALGVEALVLGDEPRAPRSADIVERVQAFAAAGPVQGVFWLPGADDEGDAASMDLEGFREGLRVRVKLLADTMRALYDAIARPGTFLVTATRLGGGHGYDAAGAAAPMGGAVTGFAKAYSREREEALVKAVDFAPDCPPDLIAGRLIDEILRDPGAVEIGYQGHRRVTVGLSELPAEDGEPGLTLGKDSVFVVTGAAGSIVAAITADLAAHSGGTFHLLDLAPAPDRDDPDLRRFAADREGLKRDLFERIKARGERATPAMVERELAALERKAAALAAMEAIERAGGVARYHQVNLTDPAAVAAALEEARRGGRVDMLMHAAGLEISRFLRDKEPREFDRVFDVKADGWHNLIRGVGGAELRSVVVFSSIAGRFGNGGQTDYSAGNDLLCKLVSNLRRARPGVRGVAVDWTAWSGIGMASRGSIPKMMELAGIDMLPPEAGVPVVRRELCTGGFSGEVVVAGKLGVLVKERDPLGGLDPARIAEAQRGPMIGRVVAAGVHAPLTVETELDPREQPFLDHHRIDGTPVLPGVMGMEGFAEIAALCAPGARVAAVEDVRFEAPFKFYRDEPRALRLEAWIRPDGEGAVAECRLLGTRALPGRAEPQVTVHFTGKVRLAWDEAPPAEGGAAPAPEGDPSTTAPEIYRSYFHGPAYQVLEAAWNGEAGALGRMPGAMPPDLAAGQGPTLIGPRYVELCFQTAGIWEMQARGRMGLPNRVDALTPLRTPDTAPAHARVTARGDGAFDAEVVDGNGATCLILRGYRTIALGDAAEGSS